MDEITSDHAREIADSWRENNISEIVKRASSKINEKIHEQASSGSYTLHLSLKELLKELNVVEGDVLEEIYSILQTEMKKSGYSVKRTEDYTNSRVRVSWEKPCNLLF